MYALLEREQAYQTNSALANFGYEISNLKLEISPCSFGRKRRTWRTLISNPQPFLGIWFAQCPRALLGNHMNWLIRDWCWTDTGSLGTLVAADDLNGDNAHTYHVALHTKGSHWDIEPPEVVWLFSSCLGISAWTLQKKPYIVSRRMKILFSNIKRFVSSNKWNNIL